MIPIFLYGDREDKKITMQLCRALKQYGGVLHVSEETVVMHGEKEIQFFLYETQRIQSIQLEQGIFIFKQGQKHTVSNLQLADGIIAIVDSENIAALEMLRKTNARAVTCGMSTRDTMTFSSIDDVQAVVSLQRETMLLSGKIAEPIEIPVSFEHKQQGFSLLALTAVLLAAELIEEDGLQLK